IGPRSVAVSVGERTDGGLEYDPVIDTLRTSWGGLDAGDQYSIQPMTLDRTALAGRPITGELQPDQWRAGTYGHAQEITDLTRSVLGDASDQDAMLQAIQAYLRGPRFSYTTTPRWAADGDPVWSFLTDKNGYCVHFASAMVEMATSVGIPMRVSVGYLPGKVTEDGSRDVTGVQAHMWPEAFFEGLGWVAYEPTPGTGDGVAGGAEQATATPTPSLTPSDSAQPSASPRQSEDSAQSQTSTPTPTVQTRWAAVWPWLVGVGGVILLGGLAALAVTMHIRRYRPQNAWDAIWQVALERDVVVLGMSLRAATAAINRRIGVQSSLADDVRRLCGELEWSRYGPGDQSVDPGSAEAAGRGDQTVFDGPALWRLKKSVISALKTQ
ncbi:MAG: transglutaminase-like domain-containing protein, partial [Propionibacteriaceae bacterium]|nr:transglutaminase-like domain-containing protein [Propionibacteriaceae bacterium]